MANKKKPLKKQKIRNSEYYDMQLVLDELYAASVKGQRFCNLVELIKRPENIKLAYRNIRKNSGSRTAGVDNKTISDLNKWNENALVAHVQRKLDWYIPNAVRRVEIPKHNGKTRPLGIPTIMDRLIQQCILQVLEPICEAKFFKRSNGFRPNHSAENAIAQAERMIQNVGCHYVIDIDIKSFFDNVNHGKLLKQMWTLGIRDKKLLSIISAMLKAEVAGIGFPEKGTPQGGIISPLLSNIVLNELDWWIVSQWEEMPTQRNYVHRIYANGTPDKSSTIRTLRNYTNLKECYVVRYADDFRIFCRTKDSAERTKCAVTLWLKERLKLEISEKKTRIVNVRNHYSDFLGFKMKVHRKGNKLVVISHIADKNLEHKREKLKEQAKRIAHPRKIYGEQGEIRLYNSMVTGMQNYYCIATHVNHDCASLNRTVMTLLTNRLSTRTGNRLVKTGRELTEFEKARFGKSKMMRYVAGTNEPVYPIGYTQHKNPLFRKKSWNYYTPEGREGIHNCLRINIPMMLALMRQPVYSNSAEYADNRISLFSAQWGKCAITGVEFSSVGEIHCHHKLPRHLGGTDAYENLILIKNSVHKLIHASKAETIYKYMDLLQLDNKQLIKVYHLRELASMQPI